jgi:hypothetical protein
MLRSDAEGRLSNGVGMDVARPGCCWMWLIGALVSVAGTADAQLIYDVDFDGPPHVVGQESATVSGNSPITRPAPTRISFGSPTVVTSLGTLGQRPVEFNGGETISSGNANYEQMQFALYDIVDAPLYRSAFDLHLDRLDPGTVGGGDQFVVLLDANTVRRLDFSSDGLSIEPAGLPSILVPFSFGTRYRIDTLVDFRDSSWKVQMNGVTVYDGSIGVNDGDLRSMRFNLSDVNGDGSGLVGLDNFRLIAIPEPGTAFLVSIGLGLLACGRRSRHL